MFQLRSSQTQKYMMTELTPDIKKIYPSFPSMLRKYARYGRKDYFKGSDRNEFLDWQQKSRSTLASLLGLEKMEACLTSLKRLDAATIPGKNGAIMREHLLFFSEEDVAVPAFLLVPERANADTPLIICPPGHNGEGKYSVAGIRGYKMVDEKINLYHYDYGWHLAELGFTVYCPDIRGFGEMRESLEEANNPATALKGDCYWLAHMSEPIGIPVLGLLVFDLIRGITMLREMAKSLPKDKRRYDPDSILTVGFSGGAMQALFLSALDQRIKGTFLSGYLYGFIDSLLRMSRNCSCNYVPHLYEHFDMGDLASLIAPRPLLVQSAREDRLNGERGIANVLEQMEIIRHNYHICLSGLPIDKVSGAKIGSLTSPRIGTKDHLIENMTSLEAKESFPVRHEIIPGPHHFDATHLKENVEWLLSF